jgi:hypothetical protein
MAHLQIHGKRMSGKKIPLIFGNTIDLEVWGPMNALVSPPREYDVSSADRDRVELTPGSKLAARNIRLYKATGKAFGIAKVAIYDGNLMGDFVQVEVLPNPSDVPFASWYAEVVPAVISALRAYAKSGGPALENKAGFFVAQAFSEQSPGKVGDPSDNDNRLFNVHALPTRDAAGRVTGVVPGQTEDGVGIKWISQGEGKTEPERTKLKSPTFVYDSVERTVTHYLKILKLRYGGAYTVITTPSASFARFAQALQDARYATHGTYAADLQKNSFTAIKNAQLWITFQMHVLADELSKTTNDARVNELKDQLDLLRDAQEQLKNFR